MAKKHKKSSFKDKFKLITNVVKRLNEQEKEKAEERKRDKKPKGYQARKIGVIAFWFIFVANILLLFVAVAGNSGSSSEDESVVATINKTSSPEVVEFGKDFLSKYFTWSNMNNRDQADVRLNMMNRYVTSEISKQVSETASKDWNATLTMEDIVLKEMEEVGKDKVYLTYRIYPTYTKTDEAIAAEMKNGVQEVNKTVRKANYMMIKVHYDEELQKYKVYEMPQFTYVAENDDDVKVDSEVNELKKAQNVDQSEIDAFLNTFFLAYATDSKDKLVYLFEKPNAVKWLNQTMEFVKLENVEVFEGKAEDEKVVRTNVQLKAKETGIGFTSTYTMVIKESNQGYVVKSMNDKAYLDSVVENDEE